MERHQTPSQTVGPFFDFGLFVRGDDNVLATDQTIGQRILVKGQITDGNGQPVPDAMIEIWQADSAGYFNHPEDPNHTKADPHFRGFGRSDTVNNGVFTFKTVKPGCVPFDAERMQAPHINVRVFARGMLIHAYTRLYFSDEAEANQHDPILSLVPVERVETLIALKEEKDDLPTYCFNIALQGENETVFFNP
jgi:protocatechuate 3,4-dioxygenase, alpha subunit